MGNLFNERKEKSTKGELLSVTLSNGVTKFSDLNKKDNSNIKSGNYKVVKKNDIPYNSMRMWQGASGVSSYDGIVSPAYTVLVPNRNSNSNFYAVLFKKKSILNLFTRFSQGLTSDTWNLKYPILKDIIVPFTNLEEQKRIFKIFNVINNLLALYERKLKLLSQVKKYFLDNLFAEKEYPNLRFKGFTDAWEQRELREIAKKRTEKNRNLLTSNVLSNSAIYGIVKQTEYFNKSIANNIQNYYLVYENDFVYNPRISNNAPFGPISRNKLNELGVMSPLYLVFYFSTKSLSDYLEIYFKSSKWHKFMYMSGNSGARSDRFAIKDNDFFRMKIKMPHSKDEINKIYKFNILLYKLLTLYETKQQHLIEIKNVLLNTMFI